METHLYGRKLTVMQDYEKPSPEVLHLIHLTRKLRWMGMNAEAERVQQKLSEAAPTGSVITSPRDTD
jgi:hypothetical protein